MNEIYILFETLTKQIGKYVSWVEIEPMMIGTDTYICGLRKKGTTTIEVHIKRMGSKIEVKDDNQIDIILNEDDAFGDIWIPSEFLADTVINELKRFKRKILSLNELEIATIETKYKNGTNCATNTQVAVFQTNQLAARRTMEIIKNNNVTMKTNFQHWERGQQQNKQMTDEEFCEMKLE